MSKWIEDIVQSLNELGGQSHLGEIYIKVAKIRNVEISKNFKSSIREYLLLNSSDSKNFKGRDIFYSVEGIDERMGIWGLRNYVISSIDKIDLTEDDLGFPEGKELLYKHLLRERNPSLIIQAKRLFKEKHGKLFCEACGFVFEEKYGAIGKDFIEAHHIKPISEMKENERTQVNDIVMVCSNCHKMLHRRCPWISHERIKELMFKK